MGMHVAALLVFCSLVTNTLAKLNGSMPLDRLAVQMSGQSEICPLVATSDARLFQTRSQTSKRHGSKPGLFLSPPWNPKSPQDLHKKYGEIFKTGNRNAASHLWVSYILDRASTLPHGKIKMLMSSFCAVSGSPVLPMTARYRAQIPKIGGGKKYGYTYHCCWPCICDTNDFIQTDTKTITDSFGTEQIYHWMVIGNPCKGNPPKCKKMGEQGCLPFEAPELACAGGQLQGAILSDNGHIIIGAFEDEDPTLEEEDYIDYETEEDEAGGTLKGACKQRAEMGYTSGMGEIFRQVAAINPL